MIRYVPTSGAETALTLTAALWALTRPPETQGMTRSMFPVLTATDDSVWLVVNTEFDIPVHATAELGEIAGILQPWIDGGHVPADTNAVLAALIEAKKGQRLTVWEAFPQLFKDQSKTRAEMITAGLLEEPNLS